jgi:probable HAF family extracellular repeat protein
MKIRKARIYAVCITVLFSLTIISTITTAVKIPGKEAMNIDAVCDISYPNQLLPHRNMVSYKSADQIKQPNPQYITIDLAEATDPLGVTNSEAVGINNNGEIVGFEELDAFKYRSIYWSQNGTASILENNEGDNSSRPYMIDDNGLILGWSALVWYEWIGEFQKLHMNQTAVTWKDKVVSSLNDEITGGDTLDLYHARDNNDAGTIVGSGAPPGNIPPPWWPNGFIFDDGIVTDLGTGTYPYAINNQGHIAGYIDADFNHAYEWENGNLIDLNDDPIIKANYSQAYDINDNNVVVGTCQYSYNSSYPAPNYEPAVWKNHEAIRILPTGHQYMGQANAVNENDEVIGYYDDLDAGTSNAFLWKDGELTILNDYLPAEQGWEWIVPDDINDYGQIVGFGYRTDIGFRAFLMTPALPIFNIEIKGGMGITASIKNTGYAPATNLSWSIVVDGGLIVLGKETTGSIPTIAVGEKLTVLGAPKGIGLGIIFPMPSIKINIICTEGVTATKTIQAKIFFSKVTLQ